MDDVQELQDDVPGFVVSSKRSETGTDAMKDPCRFARDPFASDTEE